MEMADQKFRTLKGKEIWEAPSPEEEKLIALEARLGELRKKFGQAKGKAKDSEKGGGKDNKPKAGKKFERKEKPAWMHQEPKSEELSKPRTWNRKEWWWCGHKTGGKCDPPQYRVHKPNECKGAGSRKRKFEEKKPSDTKKVVFQEAIQEIQGGYHTE